MKTDGNRGFSLPETLLALLLLSLTISALLRYQQAIMQGYNRQWQHQALWSALWLRLQDEPVAEWQIDLQKHSGPPGCELRMASTRWQQREYQLNWLFCD